MILFIDGHLGIKLWEVIDVKSILVKQNKTVWHFLSIKNLVNIYFIELPQ